METDASEKLTLQQLFNGYFQDYVQHRCRSREKIRQNFTRYFQAIEHMKVDEIRPIDLQRWHNEIGRKHGHSTANHSLQLFKAVFNYGDRFELIEFRRNPGKSIAKFPEEARTRVATADELPRLLSAIDQIGSGNRDIFKIALFTAQRISNCCAMAWDEIDFEQGIWVIPGRKFKTGSTVKVPLVDEALDILKRRKLICKHAYWVFPSTSSSSGHVAWPYASWRRILKLAKIEDLTPHDLRRTNGTKQAELGANMAVIGGNLGHRSLQSTEIYTQPQLSAKRQSMQDAVNSMLGKEALADRSQESVLRNYLQQLISQQQQNAFISCDQEAVTVEVNQLEPEIVKIDQQSNSILVVTLAASYLDYCHRVFKKSTVRNCQRLLDTYILPIFKDRSVSSITKDDCDQMRDKISAASPRAAVGSVRLLRQMFNYAVLLKLVSTHPLQATSHSKVEEIERVLDQVKRINDPSMSAAVQLGFHLGLGLRGEEITSLEWSNVDLPKRRVRLETASGRRLSKPITAEISALLQTLPSFGKCDYVFPSRKGRGHVTRIDKAWKRACLNAGVTSHLLLDMKTARQIYFESKA